MQVAEIEMKTPHRKPRGQWLRLAASKRKRPVDGALHWLYGGTGGCDPGPASCVSSLPVLTR